MGGWRGEGGRLGSAGLFPIPVSDLFPGSVSGLRPRLPVRGRPEAGSEPVPGRGHAASFVVTNDEAATGGSHTSFLDLYIVVDRGELEYSTYRKPLNAYRYLPYVSSHPLATLRGIIATECYRLLITKKFECDF